MHRKVNRSWMKHLDFILLDIICLQLASCLAYNLRFGIGNPYSDAKYLNLAIVFVLVDFCVSVIFESFKNVLKRGFFKEFTNVIKHVFLVEGLVLFYFFFTQKGEHYSRIQFFLMVPLYVLITYMCRCLWKKLLKRRIRGRGKSLLIIAPKQRIEESIQNICETNYNTYSFVGAIATDVALKGEQVCNVPIVADYDELEDYVCREWVDEVFLEISSMEHYPLEIVEKLNEMGVVVHVALTRAGDLAINKQQVERFGNYIVLTSCLNYATSMQLFWKRAIDIVGGFLGCIVTLLLLIVFGPIIYIQSPGPIFFSQERVGRNGKRFRMYKFRTMYPDAEERKKELMDKNRVGSGMMFKLDYDPRIIGCKKMPDGTIKQGIGNFLRRTSLDEFPQMFNILRGDMSLVGTRPPTLDEWEKYEARHRARMAFRPGLTGLWQVSGRSNITDFEEVVKLDTKYIYEWNLGLDIKILMKTIGVVFGSVGAL